MSSGLLLHGLRVYLSTKVEITNELWPSKIANYYLKSTKVEITNELWPIRFYRVHFESTKVEITNELWPKIAGTVYIKDLQK